MKFMPSAAFQMSVPPALIRSLSWKINRLVIGTAFDKCTGRKNILVANVRSSPSVRQVALL